MVYLPEGEDILIRTKNCHPVSHAGLLLGVGGGRGGGGARPGRFWSSYNEMHYTLVYCKLNRNGESKHSLGGFLV